MHLSDDSNPYGSPLADYAPPGPEVGGTPVAEVSIELTADDVTAFQLYHLRHTRNGRFSSLRYRLLPPAILLALGFVFLRFGQPAPLPAFAVMSVPYFFISPWLQRMHVRSQARRAPFPRPVTRISVLEYGIVDDSGDMCVARRWKLVKRLLLGPEAAYFYVDPTVAVIVPKRAFNGERQFQSFVENARRLALQAGIDLK